jgi:hypothetical protein
MKLGLSPYFIGRTLSLKQLRKIIGPLGMTVESSTTIFHYPHPDGFVRGIESIVHRICGDRLNNFMRKVFASLESLENRRTRFLTGRYLAVKAIKLGDRS